MDNYKVYEKDKELYKFRLDFWDILFRIRLVISLFLIRLVFYKFDVIIY